MLILSLVTLKFVAANIAKEMVNLEAANRLTTNLFYAGKQLVLGSLHAAPSINQLAETANTIISSSRSLQPKPGGSTSNDADPNQAASTEYLVHNWLEALFARFQMVILWHDPFLSLCTLSGFFSSFLLLTYFAPRLYAAILITIFVYQLTTVWFRHIWPEIRVPPPAGTEEESRLDVDRWTYLHPQLMTLAELRQATSNLMKNSELYLNKLIALRREKPITFCLVICSTLSCTAYIGNRVSGSTLIFCITTGLFSGPGIYLYLLPQTAKDYLRSKLGATQTMANPLEPSTSTQGDEDPVVTKQSESSKSPSSSSSSPLSLFDHLRRRSNPPPPLPPPLSMEVPLDDTNQEVIAVKQQQSDDEVEVDSPSSNRSKSSVDLSSNESASLIDFDEEQQDGFVIL